MRFVEIFWHLLDRQVPDEELAQYAGGGDVDELAALEQQVVVWWMPGLDRVVCNSNLLRL
jgi:hypothetical protein